VKCASVQSVLTVYLSPFLVTFGLLSIDVVAAEPIHSAIGVTRQGTAIECEIDPRDLNLESGLTRLLLVAGADGRQASVDAALHIATWFRTSADAAAFREQFSLSVIPCLNPDGLARGRKPANGSGGDPTRGYPPQGPAYHDKKNPEAAYVWRWIGMHAPDLVIELQAGDGVGWEIVDGAGDKLDQLAKRLPPPVCTRFPADDSLVAQLPHAVSSDVGTVPAIRFRGTGTSALAAFPSLLNEIHACEWQPSIARLELQRRLHRQPREIASELLEHYGKEVKQAVYIQALAVIGRQRYLKANSDGNAAWLAPVENIVAGYYGGERSSTPTSGSGLSGHLVFTELARATTGERRARYIQLSRAAADLAFDDNDNIKEVMPFHSEMSDAVFMGGPILASVGALTGEKRYFEACVRHLRFMRELDQRDDGLYRHSPLDESAWGRGNGFPAIGVAMCLSDLPEDQSGREEILRSFRQHMTALAKHQDPTGCWHQVIDHPESYREFTSTCMITFAIARGVRRGWLDKKTYEPIIQRAWQSIKTRIGPDGKLVDVCTGTGKQKSLHAYYDRTAILGRDPRGGAMALLVCNEMAQYLSPHPRGGS
jgi:rhamnogalacturonyl hydrolase YesR